jgi:hypothetical protein
MRLMLMRVTGKACSFRLVELVHLSLRYRGFADGRDADGMRHWRVGNGAVSREKDASRVPRSEIRSVADSRDNLQFRRITCTLPSTFSGRMDNKQYADSDAVNGEDGNRQATPR